jgi:hypothetical protein
MPNKNIGGFIFDESGKFIGSQYKGRFTSIEQLNQQGVAAGPYAGDDPYDFGGNRGDYVTGTGPFRPLLAQRNTFLENMLQLYDPDAGANYGYSQDALRITQQTPKFTGLNQQLAFGHDPTREAARYNTQASNVNASVRGNFAQYQATRISKVLDALMQLYGTSGKMLGSHLNLNAMARLQDAQNQAERNKILGTVPVIGQVLSGVGA